MSLFVCRQEHTLLKSLIRISAKSPHKNLNTPHLIGLEKFSFGLSFKLDELLEIGSFYDILTINRMRASLPFTPYKTPKYDIIRAIQLSLQKNVYTMRWHNENPCRDSKRYYFAKSIH